MDEENVSMPAAKLNSTMENRLVSMKHKFETAKLRDLLREKCRIRVKENREKNFDKCRNFMDNEKAWLTHMLKGELEENLWLQDVIYQELVEESYQWLVEQYEKELEYYATKDPNEVIAICPICQVSELKSDNVMLHCVCGASFWYRHSIEHFCGHMKNIISKHENKCDARQIFFLEPNATGQTKLITLCQKCEYYAEIVNLN